MRELCKNKEKINFNGFFGLILKLSIEVEETVDLKKS